MGNWDWKFSLGTPSIPDALAFAALYIPYFAIAIYCPKNIASVSDTGFRKSLLREPDLHFMRNDFMFKSASSV